jgi:Xaa-Pro dipeptidase
MRVAADPIGPSLRAGRLARLQAAMRSHSVDVCLLFNEPNVRYATGASAMPVWSNTTFVRCALVPAEGVPILFEHANSIHRSAQVVADVRPMHAWEFLDDAEAHADVWAGETLDAVRDLGASPGRIAVDRLGMPGHLALSRAGVRAIDSAPVTRDAREVKTPEEIVMLERNGALVMDMLGAFEAAIEPGVRERDLLAVLAAAAIRGGAEHLATNTVCSGTNGNPWRAEATNRVLQDGELVFVDTDTVGIEGYFSCVSRTFPVGEGPATSAQADTYRASLAWLRAMEEIVRPGISCAELAHRAPAMPERYLPQRYECMIHGIGLEEEGPTVCHPSDPQPTPERVIEKNVALVVELYAGEVGAGHGVKLGDQGVVTSDGFRVLAPYPFEEALAGPIPSRVEEGVGPSV